MLRDRSDAYRLLSELGAPDEVASRLRVNRWDVFAQLDAVFEEVAAGGTERLERSLGG
jgi:hypothetical protein